MLKMENKFVYTRLAKKGSHIFNRIGQFISVLFYFRKRWENFKNISGSIAGKLGKLRLRHNDDFLAGKRHFCRNFHGGIDLQSFIAFLERNEIFLYLSIFDLEAYCEIRSFFQTLIFSIVSLHLFYEARRVKDYALLLVNPVLAV